MCCVRRPCRRKKICKMNNVFWIALCTAVLLLAQSLLLRHFALKKIEYSRYFSRSKLYEGEQMEMVEIIANKKLLPVPWVRVESRIPRQLRLIDSTHDVDVQGGMYHRSAFTISAYQQITRRHRVKAVARGYFDVSSAAMTTGDLVGMSSASRNLDLGCFLTVYPKPIDVQELLLPSLKWQGDLVVRRYIMPDIFLYGGIRDYAPGDPLRAVHWGASAATGTLKVKQYDYTASPRLLLVLNVQPSENMWGEIGAQDLPDIEEGLRVVASLAEYLLANGMEVGFASNGRLAGTEETIFLHPACSFEQRDLILDACARFEIHRQRSFHQFLESLPPFKEYDLLVVTCYRSEMTESALSDIRTRGNSVGYYMLRGEAEG